MEMMRIARKIWWRKKKVGWTVRLARALGRNERIALFGGLVAIAGGARERRRRLTHS
jgi:hypothetical protein